MTTNGTHKVTDPESWGRTDEPTGLANSQSIDERLEGMLQTIRTWDWRGAGVEAVSPPADVVATMVPPQEETRPTGAREGSESLARDRSPPQDLADAQPAAVAMEPRPDPHTGNSLTDAVGPISDTAAPPVEIVSPPVEVDPSAEGLPRGDSASLVKEPSLFQDVARTEPVVMKPAPVPDTGDPPPDAVGSISDAVAPPVGIDPPPTEVDPFVEGMIKDIGVDLTSWFGHEPEPEPEPEHEGLIRRMWSHRTTKWAVLTVAAILVVILIIGGIRLFAKSPGSTGTTATTATRAPFHPHRSPVAAPINAAEVTRYQRYAAGLQSANVAATRGFIKAGSTPTASQVVLVVGAYRTAVNVYNYELYLFRWPASMQTAIAADHAQLQALTSFLQAFSSVAPNGVPAWLSQLHNRASTTEAADNVVRGRLGLPTSSSFP